jgi:serine/threonine protein kinase
MKESNNLEFTDTNLFENSYELLDKIGSGSYSDVYKVKHRLTGLVYTVKIMDSNMNEYWGREARAATAVTKYNIVTTFINVYYNSPSIYGVMPLYSGKDLLDYVLDHKDNHLVEKEALKITLEILRNTQYLHSVGYAHLDIKPENIMIHGDNIVLIDLGSSEKIGAVLDRRVGTIYYNSPSTEKQSIVNAKMDLWSIGICLYVMIKGVFPTTIDRNGYRAHYNQIPEAIYNIQASDNTKRMLSKMLQPIEYLRPTLDQIIRETESLL